ncbi:hypothetical protein RhiirA5_397443 [Rhizophagus irregularis]|uniref:Uncharacterized protein n=1 Tax=Rhizophagus irregularis TaxID=588596 RepID=A0A2I1EFL6_9GLOM|nr:hypothetical protein RhiirA5_397443 [Rhizophagus irregularis]PKC65958.1 hypothetical protein RhiirA1_441985 [Rhizophagus irregularis]PKK73698.1 hypothetical protein RhiirC2_864298 [Rhizophagus irregularis]PKY20907.1 hypothetical protein RhiirB3_470045 [Rhizophagus irregularis]
MKSHPLLALVIPIILNLIVFMSLTEGHTIWVHNKLVVGTWAAVTAVDTLDYAHQNQIDQQWSIAHHGFHLTIPDNYTTFYLYLEAIASTQDTKTRGPFNNNQDFCWHFHGSLNDWDVYAC